MYLNSETLGKWHSTKDTYIETIIQGKISMFYDSVISVAHSDRTCNRPWSVIKRSDTSFMV